jgi:hypothetical protein
MDSIVDLIATNSSPASITKEIKNALHTKAIEKIEAVKPYVANSLFGETDEEDETEDDSNESEESDEDDEQDSNEDEEG